MYDISQEEHPHFMVMPNFSILGCEHPIALLGSVLYSDKRIPMALDVLKMTRYAPVECLNAFIILLRNGVWGSFWHNYFGQMAEGSPFQKDPARGCEYFSSYLRHQLDTAMETLDHESLVKVATQLLTPLEAEVGEMVGFFKSGTLDVERDYLMFSKRATDAHRMRPGPEIVTAPRVRPYGGGDDKRPDFIRTILSCQVADPIVMRVEPNMLPIEQIQPGYKPMLLTEIAEALKEIRLNDKYTVIIQDSIKNELSDMRTSTSITLADVVRKLVYFTTKPTVRAVEAKLIGTLVVALFDHENYVQTMRPDPKPRELANMFWALVVHCGYNFRTPRRGYETATGLTVRANIFARLVFEKYGGKAKTAILNSLNGQIRINDKTPMYRWHELGYFPDLLKLIN